MLNIHLKSRAEGFIFDELEFNSNVESLNFLETLLELKLFQHKWLFNQVFPYQILSKSSSEMKPPSQNYLITPIIKF